MAKPTRSEALSTLARCKVPTGVDFHALDSDQVERLVNEAKAAKYRAPKNANGSTARYFHARLMRSASKS